MYDNIYLSSQKNLNVKDLVSQFDNYLRSYKNNAPSTIKANHTYLYRFFKWFNNFLTAVPFYELDADTLKKFLDDYHSTYSASSSHKLHFCLRSFFRFCRLYKFMKNNLEPLLPQKRVYSKSYVPTVLDKKDIEKLIKTAKSDTSHKGKRDYAMLLLLICYGVRGVQVRELHLVDIDWEKNLIHFKAVKNGIGIKQTILPEVGNALMEYIINSRPAVDRKEVFLTTKLPNKPLTTSASLSLIISKLLDKCDIKMPYGSLKGTHIFRHTFASRLLSKGESIKKISDLLGHKSYETTLIYTKIDILNLKNACLEWEEN